MQKPFLIALFLCTSLALSAQISTSKPWTRWWWQGSAVSEAGITQELKSLKDAGIGGVEITPIYGVMGEEKDFVNYLSPRWNQLLAYTISEAKKLGLGVDMATGSGWPFGGPWVREENSSKYLAHRTFKLKEGQILDEDLSYAEPGFVRSVNNQIYQTYGIYRDTANKEEGSVAHPLLKKGSRELRPSDLKRPVYSNSDMQGLALDQVRYGDRLSPIKVMAYDGTGHMLDLTSQVTSNQNLRWTAPKGNWQIIALYLGLHGKMVERAAPGGEGYVIDHFSTQAIRSYLGKFDQTMTGGTGLRAFFNDSYEVDDARGQSNYSEELLKLFKSNRGYDLTEALPALFDTSHVKHRDVLCDYRATIHDMILANFTEPWTQWAHTRQGLTRNQAHGSPANLLDLYAASDIPETEGTDMLRMKFATSVGHTQNKALVSAEALTWLNEHFKSNLADVKANIDGFLVNGVNHVFYHGTCYSPPNETWPGRLFYAATHVNDRNPLWQHWSALNQYIERCQNVLQSGTAHRDVLVYFPFYDYISQKSPELLVHMSGHGALIESTTFAKLIHELEAAGMVTDFVSDQQTGALEVDKNGQIIAGKTSYKLMVVPATEHMPLATLSNLKKLADQGVWIIFEGNLPKMAPGLHGKKQQAAFDQILAELRKNTAVIWAESVKKSLQAKGIVGEALSEAGLSFIRRNTPEGVAYFVLNKSKESKDLWLPLLYAKSGVYAYDPMLDRGGVLAQKGNTYRLQLSPGQSLILKPATRQKNPWLYKNAAAKWQDIQGNWQLHFVEGGPVLPKDQTLQTIIPWTALVGEDYAYFSGKAIYSTSFTLSNPSRKKVYLLDFGQIKESAKITINGKEIATLIGPDYQLALPPGTLRKTNTLEIEVVNLMANRIRYMDQQKMPWKKFYNINFPARLATNRNAQGLFDASNWAVAPSGIVGAVRVGF